LFVQEGMLMESAKQGVSTPTFLSVSKETTSSSLGWVDETLQPRLLNISQVAIILGLGRTKVYELIATEGLPTIRFGRAIRVSPGSLQQWLDQRQQQVA